MSESGGAHAQPSVGGLPDLSTVPPEDRDRVWLEHYYQGDSQPQLTVRAVVMGMLLGGLMSLSNLYVGLKTGWGLGVAITACILSYALWAIVMRLGRLIGLRVTPMSILENNCMQSTASSAGYSTGGTMVSAIGAFLLITGSNMPFWVLFWWTAFLALLGVSMAVPMKRQMINQEQLKFPSGIAAAETLRSLHAAGGEAMLKATALFSTMGLGAVIKWMIEGMPWVAERYKLDAFARFAWPAEWPLPFHVRGKEAEKFGLALPIDPMMVAAGAIVGMRTSVSMAVGAVVLYGILGPWLDASGIFAEMKALGALSSDALSVGNIRKWGLWTGSSMMVTAGLTAFAFQWRSIVRAFSGLGKLFGNKTTAADDPLDRIEVPNTWFLGGTLVSGLGCIWIMHSAWGIPPYWGAIAVAMSFVLSLVACRATGETDITPIGAMGKVTQLFYGIVIPQNATANLMTAGVTAGAASASADLLVDLKSGYLLGANPRKQTIAQALGIIAGTLIVVPVWYLLVPDAQAIGAASTKFPAPAAEVWASVANLLAKGLSSLHDTVRTGMVVGAVLGIALTVGDQVLPAKIRKWTPSPTGLGLAFVINFSDSMAFLIGAVLAWAFAKINERAAETYVVPVSSGIIAGESLMGIAITLLAATL